MASVVKIKRSSIQGRTPTTSNLDTGELAINLRDQKLFSSNGSTVFEVGSNLQSLSVGSALFGNTNYTTVSSTGVWTFDNRIDINSTNRITFNKNDIGNTAYIFSDTKDLRLVSENINGDILLNSNRTIIEDRTSPGVGHLHFQDNGIISSNSNITVLLDSDNNDSSAKFLIKKNSETGAGGSELFKIEENGQVTFNGAYTFPNSDGQQDFALKTDGSGNLTFGPVVSSDDIDDILSRNNTISSNLAMTGDTTSNNLFVEGDLIVSGNITTISSEELNVDTNFIVLNANLTPSLPPLLDAGIEINRGSSANTKFYWDELENRWKLTWGTDASRVNIVPITLNDVLYNGSASNNNITINGTARFNNAIIDNLNINDQYELPSSYGDSGHVLASHGNGSLYWVASNNELRTSTEFTSFQFTANTGQTLISGNDDQNVFLTYEIGKQNVFLNGIRLVSGVDYTASSGTSITLTDALSDNDIITIDSYGYTNNLQVGNEILISGSNTTSSGTNQYIIDSFSATDFISAQYFVTAKETTTVHTTTVNLAHNGSEVFTTEYGTIQTGVSLMTLDADIQSGQVRLKATPTDVGVEIKIHRTLIRA